MSQMKTGDIITLKATASVSAKSIVKLDTTGNYCSMPDTITTNLLGISLDSADTNGAVAVIINGTAKVVCGASVAAADPVGAQTGGTGKAVTVATSTTARIGQAIEAGSTNSVIEIVIQPRPVL